jgi:hydroxymethylpyrimidine pyrophosphatase-like HAD family hydrolase
VAASSGPAHGPVLIACDLDGTLLDHQGAPVPGAGEVLAELVGAGALFAVVTGRPLRAARRAATALGVAPVVYACYHGALVADASGRILRHQPLARREAREIAAEALAEGVAITVWDVDEPRELGPRAGRGRPTGDPPGDQVSRLVLHGEPVTIAPLLDRLQREWAGRLQVRPIRPGFIGVFAPQVDKGEALHFTAARLGVRLERTVACGDGSADEALLAAAAVRIAVGESPHVLGHLADVTVTDWARLPDVLRARVLPLV